MIARQLAVKALPGPVKLSILHHRKHALDAVIKYRQVTGGLGALPAFLIIGGQKCGTTYLYDRLQEHQNVHAALAKEIDFFQSHYEKGIDWYRGHFPSTATLQSRGSGDSPRISGEASGYISFPDAPARIAATVPDVKMIALLRNPVERACSHFHHVRRLGIEQVPTFEEAIEREANGDGDNYHFPRRSYLRKGAYAEQLEWWFDALPRNQFLILSSEQFYRSPVETLQEVTRFLELPDWTPKEYTKHKQFPYPKMSDEARQRLREHYRPHNERLFRMLDVDFGWND